MSNKMSVKTLRVNGDVMKGARAAKGLTQIELARMIGVTDPYIANLENGKIAVSPERLVQIAQALGIQAGLLIAGIGDTQND